MRRLVSHPIRILTLASLSGSAPWLADISPAAALDGGTLGIAPDNGWVAFEVITQGDDPAGDGFS
jgi:hypothetical protein